MFYGIICALLAGAFWGLSFVLPLFVTSFSSVEVTVGRYVSYGIFSVILLLASRLRKFWKINKRVWLVALQFALFGNVLAYGLTILGIRALGASFVAILFSITPIFASVLGNFKERQYPFSRLILPLFMIVAGMVMLQISEFSIAEDLTVSRLLYGLAMVLSCIGMWTWYAIKNAEFLRSQSRINSFELSTLIGVSCLFSSIFLRFALAEREYKKSGIYHCYASPG